MVSFLFTGGLYVDKIVSVNCKERPSYLKQVRAFALYLSPSESEDFSASVTNHQLGGKRI